MRFTDAAFPAVFLAATLLAPVAAQTTSPPGSGAPPPHGRALAEIGRSGLRSLMSASGSLGDLQNRAGSYRMAVQLERARAGALEGRIASLDQALAQPGLAPGERAAMTALRAEAREELAKVPPYEAAYRTGTVQVETLLPFGDAGGRPLFLLIRGRGHVRWGGPDGLRVLSEGASLGPVLVVSGNWIVSPGLSLSRMDVDIGAFDGTSGTTSAGPRLDLGAILGEGWSMAVQLAHVWSHGTSRIQRPGPGESVLVRSEGWSHTTTAQGELKGRFALPGPHAVQLELRPRVGAFVFSSFTPARTNSLGETGTGPFGERETLAAVRAGASFETRLGAWSPNVHAGWERELTREPSNLVDDPHAFLAAAGLGWSWARGRRLSLDWTIIRGLSGLRNVSELTLVVILDG